MNTKSLNREWVLASNKHRRNDILQFWGEYTSDEGPRSYAGYYTDVNRCEKYTTEEKKACERDYPTLDSSASYYELSSTEHFWIKLSELDKLTDTLIKKTVYQFF